MGECPWLPFLSTLKKIRSEWGLKVLVHTGLVSSETADGLAEAGIQAALLDIIGHEDTIRQVYHLRASVRDYEESLRRLTERAIPTAPHVIMGLHFGRMKGEIQALEIITRYPVKAVVLVGLRPLSPHGHGRDQASRSRNAGGVLCPGPEDVSRQPRWC